MWWSHGWIYKLISYENCVWCVSATPFYYATGFIEYEDYGLKSTVEDSVDPAGKFSDRLFIEKGLSRISPLNQFKVLQNMPLCFVSIEHNLHGDNAVVYASAAGLLQHARLPGTTTLR